MKSFAASLATALVATATAFAGNVPTGFLDASSLLVRESGNVDLNWKIVLPGPEMIDDLVVIDDPTDTITIRQNSDIDVRLIGAGYASKKGYGYVESLVKFSDESSLTNFFTGFGDDVDPTQILKQRENVSAGTELNFSFRGAVRAVRSTPAVARKFNSWRAMGSGLGHGGIIILKDGDPAPNFSPEQSNQTSVKTFLVPFLSADQKTIQIEQSDLIILVDLNKDSTESGADYQDFVIKVSVKTTTEQI